MFQALAKTLILAWSKLWTEDCSLYHSWLPQSVEQDLDCLVCPINEWLLCCLRVFRSSVCNLLSCLLQLFGHYLGGILE